jgi:hypothetical protein
MSGVTRTGGDPRPAVSPETPVSERPVAKERVSDFEAVVRAKTERRPSADRPGSGSGSGDPLAEKRDEAARSLLKEPRPGGSDDSSESKRRGGTGEDSGLVPTGPWARTPPAIAAEEAAPQASGGSRPADVAARVDEIARRIVDVLQVREGLSGAAEVRLELSLAGLGRLQVEVARGADGRVTIGFESASEKVAELVKNGTADLRTALEGRGVVLQDVTLRDADGRSHRLEAATRGEAQDAIRSTDVLRPGGDGASHRGRHDDEQKRRRGPDASELEDDEAP